MGLVEVVRVAAANPEFVQNWMRLRGISLSSAPIDAMVDETTGRASAVAQQFIADVKELIYDRI